MVVAWSMRALGNPARLANTAMPEGIARMHAPARFVQKARSASRVNAWIIPTWARAAQAKEARLSRPVAGSSAQAAQEAAAVQEA